MVLKYEVTIGQAGAAGANETILEMEATSGSQLTEVTGPMKEIFASYNPTELTRIEAVCAVKGVEIAEFSFVNQEGANLIKVELDKIVVTPPMEQTVSKAAIEKVETLLWNYAD